jgi:Protein of unknown function (DUF3662)/FHA domain
MALRDLESRLERLFERGVTRPFRATLQPVEIAQRMLREVDLARRVTSGGLMAPNAVRVWLAPEDAERFHGFQKALLQELTEAVRQHALDEQYDFVGPVSCEVFVDDALRPGDVAVKAAFVGGQAQPRLVSGDGSSYTIGSTPLTIGRTSDCDVTVANPNVSRRHAEVWRTAEGVAIRDLNSTNGTYVNGHRVTAVSLTPRDEVVIGDVRFRVELA